MPYVTSPTWTGLEDRTIRALSAELIDALLAGRGPGYALAAELNHCPGPTHVPALTDDLGLSAQQLTMTQESFEPMRVAAQELGAEFVGLESRLDEAFRSTTIDRDSLIEITAEIARVDGELRAVHRDGDLRFGSASSGARASPAMMKDHGRLSSAEPS